MEDASTVCNLKTSERRRRKHYAETYLWRSDTRGGFVQGHLRGQETREKLSSGLPSITI
jgi:hypothetical protein